MTYRIYKHNLEPNSWLLVSALELDIKGKVCVWWSNTHRAIVVASTLALDSEEFKHRLKRSLWIYDKHLSYCLNRCYKEKDKNGISLLNSKKLAIRKCQKLK